ncbi:MAG TPA: flagellin [Terriglobia bacterium]|nr:flagellin [Terriglobia bacterium]
MAISLLNNISALQAENQLNQTSNNLQSTLFQLSSGSRLNSGADDPAGLEIANGLQANITALNQSATNANEGVGLAQTADGALAQVTTLLNRATTLATEAANGTNTGTQSTALDTEFTSIKNEIDQIGLNTTYNGTSVFQAGTTSIFLSDGGAAETLTTATIGVTPGALSQASLALDNTTLLATGTFGQPGYVSGQQNSVAALAQITAAVQSVAGSRAGLGASINRLNAAQGVETAQVQNLTQAEDGITAANIPQEVANLSKFSVLNQTGISALTQANTQLQNILGLFR